MNALSTTLHETVPLTGGSVQQGIAAAPSGFYGASSSTLFRFNSVWGLVDQKIVNISEVNHLGAIHFRGQSIWGALFRTDDLPGPPRAVLAEFGMDLAVRNVWDITAHAKKVDPICFDGSVVWVGADAVDSDGVGPAILRFARAGGQLERLQSFRYPHEIGFAQGLRVRGRRLYIMSSFSPGLSGLYEFEIPINVDAGVNHPLRYWTIQSTLMNHLEGFDFVPGAATEIWHSRAAGDSAERRQLNQMTRIDPTSMTLRVRFDQRASTSSGGERATLAVRTGQITERRLVVHAHPDGERGGRSYLALESGHVVVNAPRNFELDLDVAVAELGSGERGIALRVTQEPRISTLIAINGGSLVHIGDQARIELTIPVNQTD